MVNNYKYIVEEYPYGSKAADLLFAEKINDYGERGFRLISSQLKPFKSAISNNYDMVCIFEMIVDYGQ